MTIDFINLSQVVIIASLILGFTSINFTSGQLDMSPIPIASPTPRMSKHNWTGSKIGTTEYNDEIEVIELAKSDYEKTQNLKYDRSKLLCAVFIRANMDRATLVLENMGILDLACDWAIVIYSVSTMPDKDLNEI